MKLVGLMISRNESWCIEASLRAALRWVDAMVVLNHASTDFTGAIIHQVAAEHPQRVEILEESDPVWREMEHRQKTLNRARAMGATHLAVVDADEILTENLVGSIRGTIAELGAAEMLKPSWIMCWRSLAEYRQDGSVWGDSSVCLAFGDYGGLHWSQRAVGGASNYDFHQRPPAGIARTMSLGRDRGGVLHLQHANWRRLSSWAIFYI